VRDRLRAPSLRITIVALVAGAVAFAGSFAIARAVAGDDGSDHAAVARRLPERLVTINNLERAPTIKPLRHTAGAAGAP
jgi:hypothetical protein